LPAKKNIQFGKHQLLIVILILLFFVSPLFLATEGNDYLTLHFIDVGQGDAILLTSRSGINILIDGGLPQQDNFYHLNFYLKSLGIKELDAVFLSHPHLDHMGGLIQVLDEFKVRKFFDTKVESSSQTYLKLLDIIAYHDIVYHQIHRGDRVRIGEFDFSVLHPRREFLLGSLNNLSMVLEMEKKGLTVLFTGDIELGTEKELLRNNKLSPVDILKVAHHGSLTSSAKDFLLKIEPQIAVIQSGENSFGHPSDVVITRLQNKNITTYRTDKDGDIIFSWDGRKLYLQEVNFLTRVRKLFSKAS